MVVKRSASPRLGWAPVPRRWLCTVVVVVSIATLMMVASASASAPARAVHRCPQADTPLAASSPGSMKRAVLCLINSQRTRRGLPRLRMNRRLNRSAQGWTSLMVRSRQFGHGADFAARISAAGFAWSSAGENIATGFRTPAAVVGAWMASPGHCRNILNPTFAYVGIGVSDGSMTRSSGERGTWTQDFGLPIGLHAPSADWGPADHCPYG